MLLLAHEAFPKNFEVATVDHGLRETAKKECAFVKEICDEKGIHCSILPVVVAEGNLQAEARFARYGALKAWAADRRLAAVLTAHHADDQIETLLMRLNRGSGVAGLAGVRVESREEFENFRIFRPLLEFRRAELETIVSDKGLKAIQDPSNENDRFDRARIRKALSDVDWLDPIAISKSAFHLAEANEAIEYEVNRYWEKHASKKGSAIWLKSHPIKETRLRLMRRGVRALGGDLTLGESARLEEIIIRQGKGNISGILVEMQARENELFLIFRSEPKRS